MTEENKLEVTRGDDKPLTLTFTDINGTPINITGYTVFFTVKKDYALADAQANISKTVTSHTNPTSGATTVNLTHDDTDITPGNYYYDVQVKDTSNKITTILVDDFIVQPDVTRRKV